MAIANELTINTSATALDMANAIFGTGVTVTTASFQGDAASSGVYSGALGTIAGISPTDSGVILSTGRVVDFTNSSGTTNTNTAANLSTDTAAGINGDAQLNTVAGMATFDGAILNATFVPDGDYLTMQFVFSSEEYPEYVNGSVNDAFGVWVNGTFVPVTVSVAGNVAIDEVNGGKNENLYRDNTLDQFNTEMDGITYVLSLKAPVNKGVANTIKIGIADGGDSIYDSNLLIMGDSVQTVTLANDDKINVLANQSRTFDILANDTQSGGANLTITQINGTNVTAGQTVTLTSGQQVRLNADNTVTVFANGVLGTENLTYTVTDGVNTDVGYITMNTVSSVTKDGIVSGTSGNDIIDTSYLGDPDGDRVDANDATGVQGTTGNADVIYAGAGNDYVIAGDGSDIIDADSGDDTVFGGAGNDKVTLGTGNDSFGSFNADSAGNDTVWGDGGNDAIIGGGDNDVLYGGTGNDTLSGGIGSDSLYGGDGADWAFVTDDHDLDTIIGGEGGSDYDTLAFSNYLTTGGVNVTFTGTEAGTYVFRAAPPADVASSGVFSEIEAVSGTAYADNLNATAATSAQTLLGGGGNDTITGGAGADAIDGGSGNDSLAGGAGNDTITGGVAEAVPPSYATVTGASGSVSGVAGSIGYTSVSSDSQLTASDLAAMPNGYWVGNGDQVETHTHTMSQQVAGAQLTFASLNQGEQITIWLDGVAVNLNTLIAAGTVTLNAGASGYTVNAAGQLVNLTTDGTQFALLTINVPFTSIGVQNSGSVGNGSIYDLQVNTNPVGYMATGGDDTIDAGSGDDVITAGDGNDVVTSGSGNDSIDAGAGNDSVIGGDSDTGNDTISGGAGKDTLVGGIGADLILGGTEDDALFGARVDSTADGSDTLQGEAGNDYLQGQAGADMLYGGADNDTLIGDGASAMIGGNDTLYGGLGNDLIAAGGGDDQAYGDEGNDRLNGEGGNDTLYGGAGADVLSGGLGDDQLYGDDGSDTLLGDAGNDYLNGGGQLDVVDYSASGAAVNVNLTTAAGAGGDAQGDTYFGIDGVIGSGLNDTIIGYDGQSTVPGFEYTNVLYGAAGDDSIDGMAGNDSLYGGIGNDTLLGGAGDDLVQGDAGNDSLAGGSGNDTLYGGDGSDVFAILDTDNGDTIVGGEFAGTTDTVSFANATTTQGVTVTFNAAEAGIYQYTGAPGTSGSFAEIEAISGTAYNDVINAATSTAAVTLVGNAGNDTITGGSASDAIDGSEGDDSLLGGAGNDTLSGGQGADWLIGGAGNDLMYGGEGADAFVIPASVGLPSSGTDTVVGGETGYDYDSLVLNDLTQAVTVTFTGSEAGSYLYSGGVSGTFTEIENVEGSAMADSMNAVLALTDIDLRGYAGNDTLTGGAGEDYLEGGIGDDSLTGNAGNDLINGDAGNDTIYGGLGDDSLFAGTGNDVVLGDEGNDTLIGSDGNDTLIGGAGDDALMGGNDADLIWGAAGDNVVGGEGGTDNDTLVVEAGSIITYGGGNNEAGTIALASGGTLTFSEIENIVFAGPVDGTAGNDSMGVGYTDLNGDQIDGSDGLNDTIFGYGGDDTITAGDGIDAVYGGLGNDLIDGGSNYGNLYGDEGNDTIIGGNLSDNIIGGTGDDSLSGGSDGADALYAGAGNDTLSGGAANDQLYGGDNNDLLYGGDGSDGLHADAGDDTVFGGLGNDIVDGGTGNDSILGEAGNDSIDASNGNDIVYGGDGDDAARGGSNDDLIYGDAGNDLLLGDSQNDTLYGGDGNDTVDGGFENDVIDGGAGADSLLGDDGADTLYGTAGDTVVGGEGGIDNDTLIVNNVIGLTYGGGNNESGVITFEGGGTLAFSEIEHLVLNGGNPDGIIYGTAGDDSIGAGYVDANGDVIDNNDAILGTPGSNDDEVYAGAGNDTVNGLLGNDFLYGGDGNDSLSGGVGNDYMQGDAGNDTVLGGDGNDMLRGDTGNDLVDGGAGDDSVYGGADSDTVYGGDGNDQVYGGFGDDTVYGGAGNDTITGSGQNDLVSGDDGDDLMQGSDGADTLIGGAGADTMLGEEDADSFYGGAGDYVDGYETVTTGSDNDTLQVSGVDRIVWDVLNPENGTVHFAGGGTLQFYNIEHVIVDGTEVPPPNYIVEGTGGDDLIDAGYTGDPQGDRVDASDSATANNDDLIHAGAGNDTVVAGEGNDTVYAGLGEDVLSGGAGNDQLYGETGNDTLSGGAGDDLALGGAGNDIFYDGAGNDTLSGEADRDTFAAGIGDVVDGGEGGDDYDTLDLTAWGHPGTNIIYDTMNPENGTVEFLDASGAVIGSMTFSNIENVVACFTPGAMILTDQGEVAVEDLAEGDLVLTRDSGFQPIRWVGRRDLTAAELAVKPRFNPVRIAQGALGGNLPERDMLVSPQHRMLMTGARAELLFGEHEVLVAATHMVGMAGVDRVMPDEVSYIHILFDRHEVVRADGAWSESFQPGVQTMTGLEAAQRAEILALFPNLGLGESYPAARLTLKAKEAQVLLRV